MHRQCSLEDRIPSPPLCLQNGTQRMDSPKLDEPISKLVKLKTDMVSNSQEDMLIH